MPFTAVRVTNFQKWEHVCDKLTAENVLLFVVILQMITKTASALPALPSVVYKKSV